MQLVCRGLPIRRDTQDSLTALDIVSPMLCISSSDSLPIIESVLSVTCTPLSNMTDYSMYEKLPATEPHFRLVKIYPASTHEEPTQCRLLTTEVEDSPQYEALSYCWGDATDIKAISVCQKLFRATRNLAQAVLASDTTTETASCGLTPFVSVRGATWRRTIRFR